MCGLAGLIDLNGQRLENSTAAAMASLLVHRGPDQQTEKTEGPVSFAFSRLAIIDIQGGVQPMCADNGSVWVMLNGEIYNYLELRKELSLKGFIFNTSSDTEVVLRAYQAYGLDFVRHLRGMFAISIWDRNANKLVLARDRIGEKPLYYILQKDFLAFASEIKAFCALKSFKPSLSAKALHDYLTFLYTPSSETILEGVEKLKPAHLLIADLNQKTVVIKQYWQVSKSKPDSQESSFEKASEELRDTLKESVKMCLRSDVPIGVFLSGGLDSTIITGLAAESAPGIRAFSFGFKDSRYDETFFSKKAAENFQVEQIVEFLDPGSFTPRDLIDLVWFMDEPFGDSSFLPTYWISKAARKQVKVILSGDGGDELFGGYSRYRNFEKIIRLKGVPAGGRAFFSRLLKWGPDVPVLQKIKKALNVASLPASQLSIGMTAFFDENEKRLLYSDPWRTALDDYSTYAEWGKEEIRSVEDLAFWELKNSLPDDSLVKVDRASMACALEVRAPFLDYKVVEFAARLPFSFKLNKHTQKRVLKHAFKGIVPSQIISRKKRGFEFSFYSILNQKKWRDFFIDVLSERSLRDGGIFNPQTVLKLRDAFLSQSFLGSISTYQLQHRVWAILIFHLWQQVFFSKSKT